MNARLYRLLKGINRLMPLRYYVPVFSENWLPYFDRPDFREREAALAAGLDAESLEIIAHARRFRRAREFLPWPRHLYRNADLWPARCARRRRWFTPDPAEVRRFRPLREKILSRLDASMAFPIFEEWDSKATLHAGFAHFPFDAAASLRGKALVDGGAWAGDTAMLFAELTNAAAIYAFEPFPVTFRALTRVTEGEPRIVPVRKGLGKTDGVRLACGGDTGGGGQSLLHAAAGEGGGIEMTTIDAFFRQCGLPCGCIKLDLEGMESDAVAGAVETIRRDRPLLMISLYHTARDFYEIKPFIESLVPGYRFAIRPCLDTIFFGEFLLFAWTE